ncbi:hypothetical protein OIU91_25660 [Streptomyces sp. NBC_01456]|nr:MULTISPECIES: hypothetical protein [unclassified Streptomyces]
MLRDFDSALLPYAVATVFLAFGIAYRCTARRSDPPARSLHRPDHRTLRTVFPKDTLLREDTPRGEISREDTSREDIPSTTRADISTSRILSGHISTADISTADASTADASPADASRVDISPADSSPPDLFGQSSARGGAARGGAARGGAARGGAARAGGSRAGGSQEGLRGESLRRTTTEPTGETTADPAPGPNPALAHLPGSSFQRFVGVHSVVRWVAHQLLLWGCLLAVLITVPLVWGWFTFTAATGPGLGYDMRIWGFRVIGFDSSDVIGWIVFHGLDLAALLVIAGAGYFLWRRLRDRSATPGGRVAYDLVPLLALLVISVTGLLLTFSALFLHGGGYRLLSLLHMVSVVFTLVYLPFGKFFPPVRRSGVTGGKPFAAAARQDE